MWEGATIVDCDNDDAVNFRISVKSYRDGREVMYCRASDPGRKVEDSCCPSHLCDPGEQCSRQWTLNVHSFKFFMRA